MDQTTEGVKGDVRLCVCHHPLGIDRIDVGSVKENAQHHENSARGIQRVVSGDGGDGAHISIWLYANCLASTPRPFRHTC